MRRATTAHSTDVAGAPGSRSSTTIVGTSSPYSPAARAIGVWSSRHARFASHTSVATSSTTVNGTSSRFGSVAACGLLAPPGRPGRDPQRHGGDPLGRVLRRPLLEERRPVGPVRKAAHGERPAGEVRQPRRRGGRDVADEVGLGRAVGPERLVEVRQAELRARRPPPPRGARPGSWSESLRPGRPARHRGRAGSP